MTQADRASEAVIYTTPQQTYFRLPSTGGRRKSDHAWVGIGASVNSDPVTSAPFSVCVAGRKAINRAYSRILV